MFLNLFCFFADDTLLRLVSKLVQLAGCGDSGVAMAAGRCLGMLGPVAMGTITFPAPPLPPGLQTALTCFEVMCSTSDEDE